MVLFRLSHKKSINLRFLFIVTRGLHTDRVSCRNIERELNFSHIQTGVIVYIAWWNSHTPDINIYYRILAHNTHSQAIWQSRESNLRKGKCHSGYGMDGASQTGTEHTIRVDCSQPAEVAPHISSHMCMCAPLYTYVYSDAGLDIEKGLLRRDEWRIQMVASSVESVEHARGVDSTPLSTLLYA